MTDLFTIESKVYTRLKNNVSEAFITKYPSYTITTSDKRPSKMTYPYVYVHEMTGIERGNTLENDTLAALNVTIQVEVYSDKSQTVTSDTMKEIVRIMKSMRFSVSAFPENLNTDSLYRKVARFERLIGDGDTL